MCERARHSRCAVMRPARFCLAAQFAPAEPPGTEPPAVSCGAVDIAAQGAAIRERGSLARVGIRGYLQQAIAGANYASR